MIVTLLIICLLPHLGQPEFEEDRPEPQMSEQEFREKCDRACGRG